MIDTGLQRALDWAGAAGERLLDDTLTVTAIPAPTGDEALRAEWVRARMAALGLRNVCVDTTGNVLGARPGAAEGFANVLLMAHLDTVFPAGTSLAPVRDGARVACPGIGDNSVAVAALLLLAEALDAAGVETCGTVYFAATVGEEGLGNLRGAWAVCQALRGQLDCAIAVEGHFFGRIVHEAVGSRRYNLTFRGPGGHSWEDVGRPSAIHALGRAINALLDLPLSADPRATLNVGLIEGGSGVNVVAARATAALDLRSTDQAVLDDLAGRAGMAVAATARNEGIEVELAESGARPAGRLPPDHPLVRAAAAALAAVDVTPALAASSTDANVPLALGVPAISLGITRGGGMHTPEEWIETAPLARGLQQLVLVTTTLANTPAPLLRLPSAG